MDMDYYEILGINKNATQQEIKRAYRSLAKKYHPDLNDAQNANAFFRLIQDAYENLSDTESRSQYDIAQRSQSPFNSQSDIKTSTVNEKKNEKTPTNQTWLTKVLKILIRLLLLPFYPIVKLLFLLLVMLLGITNFLSKVIVALSAINLSLFFYMVIWQKEIVNLISNDIFHKEINMIIILGIGIGISVIIALLGCTLPTVCEWSSDKLSDLHKNIEKLIFPNRIYL
ncbi:J domain-containing protein [Faecalispora sporosphaeroides]|uniref:J domain-containing protein n=1 Tax=Faecalispora sporosphaeroides TaxID=1549 RepID=UPI0003650D82|nr:DnaJ domain-containing protein [Faecalispora sporosphaeroides]